MQLATWAKEDMRKAWSEFKQEISNPIAVIGVIVCSIVVAFLFISPFLMD